MNSPLAVAILAAGSGRRLQELSGGPGYARPVVKPLLMLGGISLIERAILTAASAGADLIMPVLGFAYDRIKPLLPQHRHILPVYNPDFEKGQASSLRVAATQAVHNLPGCALCVLLADMPLVQARHIRVVWARLQAELRAGDNALAARAVHRPTGTPGHPVIFSPRALGMLQDLPDGDGSPGRSLPAHLHNRVLPVGFDDDAVIFDVDTPADFREAQRRLGE